ncbi:MAG: hypothetical protein M1827_003929 [Pycnora praestabilis]|nr:MAG: hypothetical protein M1827_003929 [Pycnora praestabilis]
MTSHSHSQQNSDAATPRSLTPDSPSPKSYEDGDLDLDKLLDFAPNRTPASPSQRTSRLSSPNAQQSRRGNSASDLLENFRSYTGRGSSSRSKVPVERMQSPTSLSGSPSTNLFSEPPKPPPPPRLRLGPSTGRSVIIDTGRGVDLARGFKSLNVNCFLNNVKGDSISQRFHERPGLKRKKLKSRRWRRRFRDGFRAVVSKVEDMRRRGW